MRKEIGVAVAAGLLTAGCTVGGSIEHSSAPSTDPGVESYDPTATYPTIDASGWPATLPSALAAEVPNVVALTAQTTVKHVDNYGMEINGNALSGLRIGPNEYLTAGHGFYDANGRQNAATRTCGSVTVKAMTRPGVTVGEMINSDNTRTPLSGTSITVEKFAGSFKDGITSTPDAAIVIADERNNFLMDFTGIKLATQAPKPGDKLYFENYEPTAQGKVRSPDEGELLGVHDVQLGYNRPAIFGAVVVRTATDGYIESIAGMKGYSHPLELVGRGGMSGGPVFNDRGELVGMSVRGSDAPETVAEAESSEAVNLRGVSAGQKVTEALVEPVTQQLLNRLQAEVAQAPDCVLPPLPGK